jgi:hypothetical protein
MGVHMLCLPIIERERSSASSLRDPVLDHSRAISDLEGWIPVCAVSGLGSREGADASPLRVMDVDSREVAGFSTHQFLSKMHTIKGKKQRPFHGEACVV